MLPLPKPTDVPHIWVRVTGSPSSVKGGESSVRRAKVVAPWRMGKGEDVDAGENSLVKAPCC